MDTKNTTAEAAPDMAGNATTPTTATPPEEPSAGASETLNLPDIQAIILSGYGHLPHAAYLFLRLPRAEGAATLTSQARAALVETVAEVTAAKVQKDRSRREKTALNLALTYAGLTALGHSEATLETFAPEFRGGMTEDYRARALGDVQENDPKHWEWGGTRPDETGGTEPDPEKMPDLLLMCFAETSDGLQSLVDGLQTRFSSSGTVVIADERSQPDMHNQQEHFGFRDSITSVLIEGGFGVKDPGQSTLKAGEFLLGYPNEYHQLTSWPRLNPTPTEPGVDVGRNGTYLVFRKLAQDVPAFWQYCRSQAESLPSTGGAVTTPEFIGAKMVGRWRSGAPLALCPFADDPALANDPNRVNDFSYAAQDPRGLGCPFGAHVHRANPRDKISTLDPDNSRRMVNHHRILRRGRSYGLPYEDPTEAAEDGQKRGLLFFCVTANIARQFEFVQQTWLTNPKFAYLWNEPDPLIGNADNVNGPAPAGAEFTIPQATMRVRLQHVPRFVTVVAGLYLFLPGISALHILISEQTEGIEEPARISRTETRQHENDPISLTATLSGLSYLPGQPILRGKPYILELQATQGKNRIKTRDGVLDSGLETVWVVTSIDAELSPLTNVIKGSQAIIGKNPEGNGWFARFSLRLNQGEDSDVFTVGLVPQTEKEEADLNLLIFAEKELYRHCVIKIGLNP